jgi:chromate transporter
MHAPKPPDSVPSAPHQPRSVSDLFISFTFIALQGFGGVLSVVQRELVDKKRWLTKAEFLEDWAVAQILPGPNVINLALMIGSRHFGLKGALAALAGILTVPLFVVLTLFNLFASVGDNALAQGALRGMSAVAAGLIAAVGLRLVGALKQNPLGMTWCIVLAVLTFVFVALLRFPLVWVLLGLGLLACALAYRNIAHLEKTASTATRDSQ